MGDGLLCSHCSGRAPLDEDLFCAIAEPASSPQNMDTDGSTPDLMSADASISNNQRAATCLTSVNYASEPPLPSVDGADIFAGMNTQSQQDPSYTAASTARELRGTLLPPSLPHTRERRDSRFLFTRVPIISELLRWEGVLELWHGNGSFG